MKRNLVAVEIAALQISAGVTLGYRSILAKEAEAVLNGFSVPQELETWLLDEASMIYRRMLSHEGLENGNEAAEQIAQRVNLGAHPFGHKGEYQAFAADFEAIADRHIIQEVTDRLKWLLEILNRLR